MGGQPYQLRGAKGADNEENKKTEEKEGGKSRKRAKEHPYNLRFSAL